MCRVLLIGLISATLLGSMSASAADSCSDVFTTASQKSNRRAHTNLVASQSAFTDKRGVKDYVRLLGESFRSKINEIIHKPDTHWLDAGGGQGRALQEFLALNPNGPTTTTLLSYETTAVAREKLDVISGRFIENMKSEELPKSDLITDVYGPLAYSSSPDTVIEKYLSALKDDGIALISLGYEHELFGHFNKVINHQGRALSFAEWIESIPGLDVRIEKKTIETEFSTFELWTAQIRKRPGESIHIPRLQALSFSEGIPPRQIWRESNSRSDHGIRLKKLISMAERKLKDRAEQITAHQFLDVFRSGSLTHPLLAGLNSLGPNGEWRHFGPLNAQTAADLQHRSFISDPSPSYSRFAQQWIDFRTRSTMSRVSPLIMNTTEAIESPSASIVPSSPRLITDFNGPFLQSYRPDQILRHYVRMTGENPASQTFIYLGNAMYGTGRATQILTRAGKVASLVDWLKQIEGLNVQIRESRLSRQWDLGLFAQIRVTDTAKLRIPELELIGVGDENADGLPTGWYREIVR